MRAATLISIGVVQIEHEGTVLKINNYHPNGRIGYVELPAEGSMSACV
jgi:hypothetical protein